MLIAIGTSFLILGLAMMTLRMASRSLGRSVAIERSNQFYFAAESGVEAALFHKNSRGSGIKFSSTTEDSQKIAHPAVSATTRWTIDGRKTGVVSGSLKQGEVVEIPFQWDNSTKPTNSPNQSGTASKFLLKFSNGGWPDDFDFKQSGNSVLVSWSVSKGTQTFNPSSVNPTNPCAYGTELICRDDLDSGSAKTIDSESVAILGTVSPCVGGVCASTTLHDFVLGASDLKLTFQSMLDFEDSGGNKIDGIPFEISTGTIASPGDVVMPATTISSTVRIGEFQRKISVNSKERTGIGAFDYVVFD